ncbi:MAG: biotin--[acetyl-CoA-carboxylase] ligase [Ornithinimicrobium sp.]
MVRQVWARPQWHSTIDSTNLALLADPRPGRVVVADHQSAGQGRRGRHWVAPAGTSLAVSVAVRSPAPPLIGWVTLLAGVAAQRALVEHEYPLHAELKWPNDVLVVSGGAGRPGKVCGVLASAQGSQVVVGVGLNIDQGAADLPVASATSWRMGRDGSPLPRSVRKSWLEAYLGHLANLLEVLADDSDAARAAYVDVCGTLGQEVSVELAAMTVRGRACGVDRDGALVVTQGGRRSVHHAGDVVHLRK